MNVPINAARFTNPPRVSNCSRWRLGQGAEREGKGENIDQKTVTGKERKHFHVRTSMVEMCVGCNNRLEKSAELHSNEKGNQRRSELYFKYGCYVNSKFPYQSFLIPKASWTLYVSDCSIIPD